MNLQELIAHLIKDQGLSEEEALEAASALIKARRGGNIQRVAPRSAEERKFSPSAQDYDRTVDYGEETAAEAQERWYQQEMNDPDGLFAGGATMGGVFGEGAVSMANFDPMARSRAMNNMAQVQQLRATQETLRLLQEMSAQQQRRELPPEPQPQRLTGFGRFLASKKKDR